MAIDPGTASLIGAGISGVAGLLGSSDGDGKPIVTQTKPWDAMKNYYKWLAANQFGFYDPGMKQSTIDALPGLIDWREYYQPTDEQLAPGAAPFLPAEQPAPDLSGVIPDIQAQSNPWPTNQQSGPAGGLVGTALQRYASPGSTTGRGEDVWQNYQAQQSGMTDQDRVAQLRQLTQGRDWNPMAVDQEWRGQGEANRLLQQLGLPTVYGAGGEGAMARAQELGLGDLYQGYDANAPAYAQHYAAQGQDWRSMPTAQDVLSGPQAAQGMPMFEGTPKKTREEVLASIRGYSNGGAVDNVPAMLSEGEYVLPRETAGLLGQGVLDRLVRQTTGREPGGQPMGGLLGYADGGAVYDYNTQTYILPDGTRVPSNMYLDQSGNPNPQYPPVTSRIDGSRIMPVYSDSQRDQSGNVQPQYAGSIDPSAFSDAQNQYLNTVGATPGNDFDFSQGPFPDLNGGGGGGGGGGGTTTPGAPPGGEPGPNPIYGLQPRNPYPYQTFIPRNQTERAADQLRGQYATTVMPGLIGSAQNTWGNLQNAPDVGNNPWVQGALDANKRNVTRAVTEDWMPSVHANAVGTGNYGGSSHAKMQERMLGRASDSLANANANTLLGAYGQGLGAAQSTQPYAGQMAALGNMPADIIGGIGANQRMDQQQVLDDSMYRYNFLQNEPERYLGAMSGNLNMLGSTYGTHSTPGPQSSPLASGLGTAATVYPFAKELANYFTSPAQTPATNYNQPTSAWPNANPIYTPTGGR